MLLIDYCAMSYFHRTMYSKIFAGHRHSRCGAVHMLYENCDLSTVLRMATFRDSRPVLLLTSRIFQIVRSRGHTIRLLVSQGSQSAGSWSNREHFEMQFVFTPNSPHTYRDLSHNAVTVLGCESGSRHNCNHGLV